MFLVQIPAFILSSSLFATTAILPSFSSIPVPRVGVQPSLALSRSLALSGEGPGMEEEEEEDDEEAGSGCAHPHLQQSQVVPPATGNTGTSVGVCIKNELMLS